MIRVKSNNRSWPILRHQNLIPKTFSYEAAGLPTVSRVTNWLDGVDRLDWFILSLIINYKREQEGSFEASKRKIQKKCIRTNRTGEGGDGAINRRLVGDEMWPSAGTSAILFMQYSNSIPVHVGCYSDVTVH
jgi:hypothetical protein